MHNKNLILQSSGTKPVVEVISFQQVSPLDQKNECPYHTCIPDMHSNFEVFRQEKVPITIERECQADEKQLGMPNLFFQLFSTADDLHDFSFLLFFLTLFLFLIFFFFLLFPLLFFPFSYM